VITLADLAQLYAEHGADLDRPVAPVAVTEEVTIGDGHVTLMGTVNLSPDSTYRESIAHSTEAAIRKGRVQTAQGAAIVDLGAEASGDDARRVGAEEQLERQLPVVAALAKETVVSVETYRPEVVRGVLEAGARMINLTGRKDEDEMLSLIAAHDASVLMCFGLGDNVRANERLPDDRDLLPFLIDHFAERIEHARGLGVDKIVIDPGMGFSFPDLGGIDRARLQSRVLVQSFRLRTLGVPVGSVLPHTLQLFEDQFRTAEGFHAVFARLAGVHLLRVHEVPHLRTVLTAMETLEIS
jgi:dihydropteroate synthase